LVSEGGAGLEARWISVPPNVWHQAVVPDQDWVVVSFHTVPAHELIEERPDAEDASRTHQRQYLPSPGDRAGSNPGLQRGGHVGHPRVASSIALHTGKTCSRKRMPSRSPPSLTRSGPERS